MRRLKDALFRLTAALVPGRLERQLDDEVAFHLEMETQKLVAAGMTEADAAREARRRFGGLVRQKERARESWGIGPVQDLVADVRHAFRQLRRHPAFSGVAILTLALGIGVTVALFSVVSGLLLRPLPYADEERVVVFWSEYNWRGIEFDFARERVQAYDAIAAFSIQSAPFRGGGGTELLVYGVGSAELFDVLGAPAALGRTFVAGKDRPGAEAVIVLGHGLWMQEFGGDPDVIGARVDIGGQRTTVVGVMPEGFYFPTPQIRAWRPVLLDPSRQLYHGNGYLTLIGRVHANTTPAALERDVQNLAAALGERFEYPDAWDKSKNAQATPIREYLLGDVEPALLLLLGAVGLLLLMACANAAALILARTTDRAGEMAVRTALGAGRWRLARQVLVESVVLAAVAGVSGAALAFASFDALVASLPLGDGFADAVALDWTLFGATFVLALVVGSLVAIIPVRGLLRGRLAGEVRGVRGAGARSEASRVHAALVAAEVVLAVTLVTGAALLIRSVAQLQEVEMGVDPEGVVTADLVVGEDDMGQDERRAFLDAVAERTATLPGVEAAGLVVRLPIRDGGWQAPVSAESRQDLTGAAAPNAMWRSATPDYFRAIGIDLVRGRMFDGRDQEGSIPVTVVSESFASLFWPDGDPIGQRVQSAGFGHAWLTVIGVVEETRMFGMTGRNTPVMYVPLAQAPFVGPGQVLVLRAQSPAATLIPAVRRLVGDLDPRVAVSRPGTMQDVVNAALAEPLRLRFFLLLFALLALTLGTIGVYGVVSYAVTRRRAEFGIRMALGAAPADVLGTVVRHGMAPVIVGVVGGLAGSFALARIVERFLYGVAPTDPASLGVAALVLLAGGILAALVPAIRAGRVNPVEALRAE